MKHICTLAIIATLGLVSARADHEIFGSPKWQEANWRPLTSTGSDVRHTFEYRGGKGAYASHPAVTNGARDRDLVREQRSVVYTGKNPRRDLRKQFEVAPVK